MALVRDYASIGFAGKSLPDYLRPNAIPKREPHGPTVKVRRDGLIVRHLIDGELIDLPLPRLQNC